MTSGRLAKCCYAGSATTRRSLSLLSATNIVLGAHLLVEREGLARPFEHSYDFEQFVADRSDQANPGRLGAPFPA